MKKILFLFAVVAAAVFTGCSKDEDGGSQTIMINVFYKYPNSADSDKKIASPTLVLLYDYAVAQNIDLDKSVFSVTDYYKITLKDGTTPACGYSSSPNFTGINTFENIPDGEYMAIVYYKPEGYSLPRFFCYGYKRITVEASNKISSYDFLFRWGSDGGDNGHFIEL